MRVSAQSQANRMELVLQEEVDGGQVKLPLVEVNLSEHDSTGDVEADLEAGRLIDAVGKITILQVPHRRRDGILRDSKLDGQFIQHYTVRLANTTPLFELCATALLFGMCDFTSPKPPWLRRVQFTYAIHENKKPQDVGCTCCGGRREGGACEFFVLLRKTYRPRSVTPCELIILYNSFFCQHPIGKDK